MTPIDSRPSPIGNVADIDRDNPWPGLSSFTEDARGFFFGREKETDELARLVRRETLTVLFGQSGLGKSSLLQAGLFPLLRETDHLPLYLRLDHSGELPIADGQLPNGTQKPGAPAIGNRQSEIANRAAPIGTRPSTIGNSLAAQVKQALNAAFASAKADAPLLTADESLWEYFHRKDVDIWSAKNRLLTPVLAFDQFEEIFTLGRADEVSRARSAAFLAELADLVENRPPAALREKFEHGTADPARYNFDKPSCRVILSLREDFLPDLEGLKQELPALIHNRLRLKRLNGAQALEAVTRPAPHLLTEGVGEKIVEFVAGAKGGSIERLAELDVEPPLLSVICRELNERRRAMGQDKITADLVSGNRREILTDFYERSVADLPEDMRTFVEDRLLTKSGFRDNLALETALETRGVTRPLIDTLVSRRLLRIEERMGVQRVELTHDVLAEVIRASRDTHQQQLAIQHAGRRTRRLRWAVAGLGAAVVALVIGAFFGLAAQRRATAQAGRGDLLLGSRMLDEGKLIDGLAYLVSAGRKDPTNPVVAPRLLTALAAHNFVLPVGAPLTLPSPGLTAAYSADGRRIFVQCEDDVLRSIDTAAWKVEREFTFAQKIRRGGVALAEKNDAVLAVVLIDGSIVVADTASGAPRFAPLRPPEPILGRPPRFALSPDGKALAATNGQAVWVWDAGSGQLRATLPNNSGYSRSFEFSPDSQRIVTNHGERITQMWSVNDGSPRGQPISAPQAGVPIYAKFTADGRRLLAWYFRGWLVCDANSGKPLAPFVAQDAGFTGNFTPSADGTSLLLVTGNRILSLDALTGKPSYSPLEHGGPVYAFSYAAEGKILLTNSVDGLFRLWDVKTGALLAEPTFRQDQYTPAAVSPNGQSVALFTSSGQTHQLHLGRGAAAPLVLPRFPTIKMASFMPTPPSRLLWFTDAGAKAIDVASGRESIGGFVFPKPLPDFNGGAGRSQYGGTTGAGLTLFVRPSPGEWHAWTLGEAGVIRDVQLKDIPANVNGFRNTARRFTTATASSIVGIWHLESGEQVGRIEANSRVRSPDSQIVFDPAETKVAFQTDADAVVHVHESPGGRELFTVQLSGKESISTFRFSPNGAHLLTGGDWGGVQVWDARTGKLLQTTQAHRTQVTRFDFSPDGSYYASLSADGSVQVWESATHLPVGLPLVQTGRAARADFSPDGSRLVTPSLGGTARIWDVRSGLPLTDPMEHHGVPIGIVAYSPDGKFVNTQANASATNPAQLVWAAPPESRGARTPGWLLRLATICLGHRLDEQGKLVSAAEVMGTLDEVRREIAALPASDPYAEWARWFLSDSPTRSIAPGFTITPAEARKLAEDMKREQLAATPPRATAAP